MVRSKEFSDWKNEVLLTGRVTSEGELIELPSGESLIRFRIVVPRHKPTTKTTVDTIDCVSFKPAIQRTVSRLEIGDIVTMTGTVRRRFWKAGPSVASRVEVEVATVKKVR